MGGTQRLGERHEVRALQAGSANAFGIAFFLVHADGSVHPVVDHQHDETTPVLGRRGEFLRVHEETAVPGDTQHLAVTMPQRCGDCGRYAIAHCAAGGGQF